MIDMLLHRGDRQPRVEAAAAPPPDENRQERSDRVVEKTTRAAHAARTAAADWNNEVRKADRALVGRR